jgi:hypothetical protein
MSLRQRILVSKANPIVGPGGTGAPLNVEMPGGRSRVGDALPFLPMLSSLHHAEVAPITVSAGVRRLMACK